MRTSFITAMFTWKTYRGLKFHFGQIDESEICTDMSGQIDESEIDEVSFTSPELMWTLIMKLP